MVLHCCSLLFCVFLFVSNNFLSTTAHELPNPLSQIKYHKVKREYNGSVRVLVNPTVINSSYIWARIDILGVSSPSESDWLGLFTLRDDETTINASQHAPVKFRYCNTDTGYLLSGAAQFYFYLINMRHDYMLGFFTGGIESPVLVSMSDRIVLANPNQPLQGHLALTPFIDQVILQWNTKNTTDPIVQWGLQSGKYMYSKKANNTKYTVNDLCGPPATDYGWMDPGTFHTVTMDHLQPSTRYYYRFGSNSTGWSKEFSFKSAPLTGPNSSVRIITYGDLGHGEQDDTRQVFKLEQASLNTTKNVFSEINDTDLIVHIGDLSYADGFSAQWDEYFHEIERLAANVPYMVCTGNHESDWPNTTSYFQSKDSGGECNIPYIYRNPMPRQSTISPWYGFNFGCVHFVVMSAENNFTVSTTQYEFLVRHLETINRTETPWLIFTGHRPMYVDSTSTQEPYGMQPIAKLLRDNLEDLLVKYKVDLALWGHHHTYQRTCKLYKGQCTDNGVPHIIIGMAGRPLLQDFEPTPPSYFKYLDDQHYGYTRLFANSTTLTFQYIRNDDLMVHDEIVLSLNSSMTNSGSKHVISTVTLTFVLFVYLFM